jgi:SAM-dependent methyltransferase
MTPDAATVDPHLARVLDLLACPDCRGELRLGGASLECAVCGTEFPIEDGVPLLARTGSAEAWAGAKPERTSERYQRTYERVDAAASYDRMYRGGWGKRWSTRREYALLGRLLGRLPRSATLLELPCGGGRLSPRLAQFADLLIEADIALGQIHFGRANGRAGSPQVWMTASAFHVPLRDASVDGAVCVRLSHHLPTPAERERLFRELLRVARRFVVVTYFDHHSLKNAVRRLGRPLHGKPPKMTMTTREVRDLARDGGARLVACPALSFVGSGHRYALLAKGPA